MRRHRAEHRQVTEMRSSRSSTDSYFTASSWVWWVWWPPVPSTLLHRGYISDSVTVMLLWL